MKICLLRTVAISTTCQIYLSVADMVYLLPWSQDSVVTRRQNRSKPALIMLESLDNDEAPKRELRLENLSYPTKCVASEQASGICIWCTVYYSITEFPS